MGGIIVPDTPRTQAFAAGIENWLSPLTGAEQQRPATAAATTGGRELLALAEHGPLAYNSPRAPRPATAGDAMDSDDDDAAEAAFLAIAGSFAAEQDISELLEVVMEGGRQQLRATKAKHADTMGQLAELQTQCAGSLKAAVALAFPDAKGMLALMEEHLVKVQALMGSDMAARARALEHLMKWLRDEAMAQLHSSWANTSSDRHNSLKKELTALRDKTERARESSRRATEGQLRARQGSVTATAKAERLERRTRDLEEELRASNVRADAAESALVHRFEQMDRISRHTTAATRRLLLKVKALSISLSSEHKARNTAESELRQLKQENELLQKRCVRGQVHRGGAAYGEEQHTLDGLPVTPTTRARIGEIKEEAEACHEHMEVLRSEQESIRSTIERIKTQMLRKRNSAKLGGVKPGSTSNVGVGVSGLTLPPAIDGAMEIATHSSAAALDPAGGTASSRAIKPTPPPPQERRASSSSSSSSSRSSKSAPNSKSRDTAGGGEHTGMPAMAVAAAAGATVGQSVVGSGGRGGKVRARVSADHVRSGSSIGGNTTTGAPNGQYTLLTKRQRANKSTKQQEQQARTKTNGRKTACGPAAADAAAGAAGAAGAARKAAGRVEGGDNRTRSHGRRKGAPAPLQYLRDEGASNTTTANITGAAKEAATTLDNSEKTSGASGRNEDNFVAPTSGGSGGGSSSNTNSRRQLLLGGAFSSRPSMSMLSPNPTTTPTSARRAAAAAGAGAGGAITNPTLMG